MDLGRLSLIYNIGYRDEMNNVVTYIPENDFEEEAYTLGYYDSSEGKEYNQSEEYISLMIKVRNN